MPTAVLCIALSALVMSSTLLAAERVSPQEDSTTTFALVGGHIAGPRESNAGCSGRPNRRDYLGSAEQYPPYRERRRSLSCACFYRQPRPFSLPLQCTLSSLAVGSPRRVDLAAPVSFLTKDFL